MGSQTGSNHNVGKHQAFHVVEYAKENRQNKQTAKQMNANAIEEQAEATEKLIANLTKSTRTRHKLTKGRRIKQVSLSPQWKHHSNDKENIPTFPITQQESKRSTCTPTSATIVNVSVYKLSEEG